VPAGSTPIATAATLGGVIVGSGLAVDAAGKISTTVIVDATSTTKGIVKLASADDITNAVGTSAVTPAQLVAQMATLAKKAGPTFTGQSSFAGGTVAAPGITFSGDSNTGLTTGGKADELYISAGGRSALSVASGTTTLYSTSDVRAKAVLGSSSFSVHIGGGQTELIVEKDKVTVGENVYPLTKGTDGQLLQTNGAGTLSWANIGIDDLTDVDTTTAAPTDGQTLLWKDPTNPGDSGKWVPGTPATTLDSLTDVDASAPAAGEVLTFHAADATVTGDTDRWISKAAVEPGDSLEFDNAGKLAAFFECNDGAHHALSACKELMQLFAGCHYRQPINSDGTPATGWIAVGKYLSPYLTADVTTGAVTWQPSAGFPLGKDVQDAINAIAATATVADTTAMVGGTTDYPGNTSYAGGVLLPDGRVCFAPRREKQVTIFDPKTNTTTMVGGATDFPGNYAYYGGVLLPDGRVCFAPQTATQMAVFDPKTNVTTMVGGATDYPGGAAFAGGVALSDGRVCFAPYNARQMAIFDPKTNTTAMVGGTADYPGGNAYVGGVLLPDGRVCFAPYNAKQMAIFDPKTNTTTKVGGTADYPGGNAYAGGVLLPDGRVCFAPHNATQMAVFDPKTNTTAKVGGTADYPGGAAYYGGVLLPDGRVCFAPYNARQVATYGGGPSFPMSVLLGPYLNKL
jgi:hypothetical protein